MGAQVGAGGQGAGGAHAQAGRHSTALSLVVTLPVALLQVSGEYAMLYHAGAAGALDLKRAVMETLVGASSPAARGRRRGRAMQLLPVFAQLQLCAPTSPRSCRLQARGRHHLHLLLRAHRPQVAVNDGLCWSRRVVVIASRVTNFAVSGGRNVCVAMSLGVTLHVLSNGAESTGPCLAVDVHRVSAVSGERTALQQVLVNAGECSTRILNERGIKLNATDVALFTRCAPDTLAGVPALIFHLADRGAPDITLAGPPPLRQYHATVQSFVHRRYPRVATDESPFFSYSCGVQFNADGGSALGPAAVPAASRPGLPRYSWASAKLAAAAAQARGRSAAFRGRVTELPVGQPPLAAAAGAGGAAFAAASASRPASTAASASFWQVQLPAPGTAWAGVMVHALPIRSEKLLPARASPTEDGTCPCRAVCPVLSSATATFGAPLAAATAAATPTSVAPPASLPATVTGDGASKWRDASEIDVDADLDVDGEGADVGAAAFAPAPAASTVGGAAVATPASRNASDTGLATCTCTPRGATVLPARPVAAVSAVTSVECHCYLITISGPALEDEPTACGADGLNADDDSDDSSTTSSGSGGGSITSGTITDDEDAGDDQGSAQPLAAATAPRSAVESLKRDRPPALEVPTAAPPLKRRKTDTAAAVAAAAAVSGPTAAASSCGAATAVASLRSARVLIVDVPPQLVAAAAGSQQHHCGACTRAPPGAAVASVFRQLREHLSAVLRRPTSAASSSNGTAGSDAWTIVHMAPCSLTCTPWYRAVMVDACAACISDAGSDSDSSCICLRGALSSSSQSASRCRIRHVFVHECTATSAAASVSMPSSLGTHFPALLRQSVRLHVAARALYPDPAPRTRAATSAQPGFYEPAALLHDGLQLLGRTCDGAASSSSGILFAAPAAVDADDVAADARACLAAASGASTIADAATGGSDSAAVAGGAHSASTATDCAASAAPVEQVSQRMDPVIAFLGTGAAAPSKRRSCSGVYVSTAATSLDDCCASAPRAASAAVSHTLMRECIVQGGFMLDVGEGCLSRLQLLAAGLLMRSSAGCPEILGFSALDSIIAGLSFVWVSHMHADHHTGLPRLLQARHAVGAAISAASGGSLQLQPLVVTGPAALRQAVAMYLQLLPAMPIVGTGAAAPVAVFVPLADFAPCSHLGSMRAPRPRTGEGAALVNFRSFGVDHSCREAYGCTATVARHSTADESEALVVVYSGDTRPCTAVVEAGVQACAAQLALPPAVPAATPVASMPVTVATPMMMMPMGAPQMQMHMMPMMPFMMPVIMPTAMQMPPRFLPGMMPGHMHGFPLGPAMPMGMPFQPPMAMMMAPPMPAMMTSWGMAHPSAAMLAGAASTPPAPSAAADVSAGTTSGRRVRVSVLLIHEATFDDDRADDAIAKRHATVGEALSVGDRLAAAVERLTTGQRRSASGGDSCRFVGTVLTHFSQRYPKLIAGATATSASVAAGAANSSDESAATGGDASSSAASSGAGATGSLDEPARRRICAFDGLVLPLLPLSALHDRVLDPAACDNAHAAIECVLEPLAAAAGTDGAVATDVTPCAVDNAHAAFS